MAKLSTANPLGFVIKRHYGDTFPINNQQRLIRERLNVARNLYKKDLFAHYGCVNAIEFSNKGEFLVSGGDDRRVLLWNLEQAIHGVGQPAVMRGQHMSNIFCLGFDSTGSKIFSAGNDDQVIVHDASSGAPVDNFLHEQPVYGISIDPLNDNVFASACDDGRILIYDIREPANTEPFCLAQYSSAFHAVMFNPVEPRILTTANSKEGVGLWDVRKPRKIVIHFGGQHAFQSCMSVRFNSTGSKILALRRRLPPVIYAPHSPLHLCQFDHAGYYNSCTMKSCSFGGDDDQYVLSGSDDFNLYVWKVPSSDEPGQWIGSAHMVLEGHRSIVNQVRYDPSRGLIASSGVEKLIKLWSPFSMPHSSGSLFKGVEQSTEERKVYTHEEYISLVLRSGEFMSHDYTSRSTEEDPRMMAFFDSLVQREIEGWTSEDSSSSESTLAETHMVETRLVQAANRSVPAHPPPVDTNHSHSRGTELQANVPACVEALAVNVASTNGNVESENAPSEPNRISQLIARKRAQLIRLAQPRTRSSGQVPSFSIATLATPCTKLGKDTHGGSGNNNNNTTATTTAANNNSNGFIDITQPGNSGTQNGKPKSSGTGKSNKNVRKRRRLLSSSDSDSLPLEGPWCGYKKSQVVYEAYKGDSESSSGSSIGGRRVRDLLMPCHKPQSGKSKNQIEVNYSYSSDSDDLQNSIRSSALSTTKTPKSSSKPRKKIRRSHARKPDFEEKRSAKLAKNKSNSKQLHKSSTRKKSSKPLEKFETENSNRTCSGSSKTVDNSEGSKLKNTYHPKFVEESNVSPSSGEDMICQTVKSNEFSDSSNSDEENFDRSLVTPNGKKTSSLQLTPDSGISIDPCSSKERLPRYAQGSSGSNGNRKKSDDKSTEVDEKALDSKKDTEWKVFKRYRSRLRGLRRNYRNHVSDSDSN